MLSEIEVLIVYFLSINKMEINSCTTRRKPSGPGTPKSEECKREFVQIQNPSELQRTDCGYNIAFQV